MQQNVKASSCAVLGTETKLVVTGGHSSKKYEGITKHLLILSPNHYLLEKKYVFNEVKTTYVYALNTQDAKYCYQKAESNSGG